MKVLPSIAMLAVLSVPAHAQQATPPADDTAVRAVITRMFDAMRARDTAAFRSIFAEGARLISTGNRNGTPAVEATPVEAFIGMISTAAPGQLLDERLQNTTVSISDNLASVWTDYRFYIGERFSHCGVDAILLARDSGGWKIIALADTRRPAAECGN